MHSGFTVDPVAFGIRSGATAKKNSQRRSSTQAAPEFLHRDVVEQDEAHPREADAVQRMAVRAVA